MKTFIEPETMAAWRAGAFTDAQLAAGLACDAEIVRAARAPYGAEAPLTGRQRIGLAVAAALHGQAGIPLPAAVALANGCGHICDSVLATVDFVAPEAGAADGGQIFEELDPLMLFAPHSSEALAVPAIDAFLDVMDGRRIHWRRPRRDAYGLACELHRLGEAAGNEATPAAQEELLALLSDLRGPVDQVCEWVGSIADGTFRAAPNRFPEAFPAMRQGLDATTGASRWAETYATRTSVNISLAARSFKRRMLGLAVTDPLAQHTRHDHEGGARTL